MIRAAVAVAAVVACAPPRTPAPLARAERLVEIGAWDRALAAYDDAIAACPPRADRDAARDPCVQALLGRAELLDRMGRGADAADAYEAIPAAVGGAPVPTGTALYRAGALRLRLGDDARAYALWWRAIAEAPDTTGADDAVRALLRDGRRRDPRALYRAFAALAERLADTAIADNLLFALADLARNELGEPRTALALYDAIAERWPNGPLFDDALWHGGKLARALGDPRGAVARWRKLLATREVAWFNGSYNSEWFDDAWLQIAVTLRDDLGDTRGALAALAALDRDYPASVLRDDAAFERAATYAAAGDADRACRALARLRARWPDSKYELERAPALRARLACRL